MKKVRDTRERVGFENPPEQPEPKPTHVICPACGYDYEIFDGYPRECDCGHVFTGREETV